MALRSTMTTMALTAAALALCACDSPLAQRLGFHFNQDGQDANLAFGAPNSDDVDVMLECSKGSRQVQLTDVAEGKDGAALELASAGQRLVIPAKVSTDDESGARLAQAALPLDAPVLRGFRDSGVLAVNLGRSHHGLRARSDDRSAVADFFSACGGPSA